jgi:hypothetical protein
MLIGLVMYISVFKAEIGYKLREPSINVPPVLTYRYGYSFILYVSGFITIEIAGISAVFLFIYWYQKDWLTKLSEKHFSSDKYSPGSESNISYTNLEQSTVYPCKKHPQAYTLQRTQPIGAACEPSTSNSNNYGSTFKTQPRYYYDNKTCSLHSKKNTTSSASLRDVSASTSSYEFPPPPPQLQQNTSTFHPYNTMYKYNDSSSFMSHGSGSTRSMHLVGANMLPRDATTNTISTTVDVMNACEEFGFNEGCVTEEFTVSSNQREHEFVTFDLERPLELRSSISANLTSNATVNRKESATDTLRRTTPV